MPAAAVALLLLPLLLGAEPVAAVDLRTPSLPVATACDCKNFGPALAEAEAVYKSRQEGIEMPLTPVMHDRYRARVDVAYAHATCLTACEDVPETDRNRARVLLAESGFKDASLGAMEWQKRLTAILAATTRCLEVEPKSLKCQLWHASSRGILARGSWNPLNIRLPIQLMAEFKSARGGAAPGRDSDEGAATRGEATMLLRVPRFAGGDPAAGRALIEAATKAPTFGCRLANRMVVVEALARTGDLPGAERELKAIRDGGLPDCGACRYENAMALAEAERCLTRLAETPGEDPGFDNDCRKP
jgi:hypothetical protein